MEAILNCKVVIIILLSKYKLAFLPTCLCLFLDGQTADDKVPIFLHMCKHVIT